jgi:hypothetical protein
MYTYIGRPRVEKEKVAEFSSGDREIRFKDGIDRSKLSEREESEIYFTQHDEENDSYTRINSYK